MAILPALPVAPPQALGLRYGLFTVATGPLPLPEHGRGGGIIYEPVSCGRARRYPINCHTPATPPDKVFDAADPYTEADPFLVYATYRCGAVGQTAASIENKVRQRLANGEQGQVEQQLAEDLAVAVAADGTALVAADPTSLISVVGELEQWLYGTMKYGNVGFLHAPVRMASYANDLVVNAGPAMRTRMGTRWVFGDYPDGVIFISGHVTVYAAEQVMVPPPTQTLNRTTNQWNALAEREFAVAWDCLAASAEFDHGALS